MRHHFKVGVRMCILADSVDTRIFYPPDTTLYQVSGYVTVSLVEVRHSQCEPTVNGQLFIIIGSIRVHLGGSFETGLHVVSLKVEPIFGRHVFE